jgi:glycogen(starch) synthase
LRILIYSRAFPPAVGGIERFAETLASELCERGHSVIVATQTPAESEGRGRPYGILRRPSVDRLLRVARSADIVHANGMSLRAVVMGASSGTPTVVTHQGHQAICPTGLCMPVRGTCDAGPSPGPCSGCPDGGARGLVDVRLHAAASRMAVANVSVSDYLRTRLRLPRDRTIYSPVSQEAFEASTDSAGEDGLVAFAGRLVSEKGLEVLLRALADLDDVRLVVLGDGPMASAYQDLADELGLSLRVSFLGAQPFERVAREYARAAVVCVPTICEEAFGFAAAEAMAMRRPLVVTPSGSLTELAAGDRAFAADGRGPAALAMALRTALGDVAERGARAARGQAFARERFTQSLAGAAYEALYEEVLS